MIKRLKNNPGAAIIGLLFIASMVFGFVFNIKTKLHSEDEINQIKKKSDSTIKLMSDSINFAMLQYNDLQIKYAKLIKDSIALHKEIKSLNKIVTKYVKTKDLATYNAVRELSSDVSKLESEQRERVARQRERELKKVR